MALLFCYCPKPKATGLTVLPQPLIHGTETLIDVAFSNAHETMHSWCSTPQGSVTLLMHGQPLDMVCGNLLACMERTIDHKLI